MAVIGVDMDGVLAVFDKSYSDILIKVSGRDLFPHKPYEPPCWDWTGPLGYTKEEESKAWAAIKEDSRFWECLEEYPDAQEVIDRLWKMQASGKHAVYFITNRLGIDPKGQTDRWLYNRTPTILPSPTVLVSAHKGMSAAALELTHYIDDKPSNCTDVIKARGLKTLTYLMDRPWNQEYSNTYVQRVKSVHAMLDAVEMEVPVGV